MTKQEFVEGVKRMVDDGPLPVDEIRAIGEFDPVLESMLLAMCDAYNKALAHCKTKLELK